MPKVILLSQFPLPYHKIGSWTNMYKSYLAGNHKIDYIICEKPQKPAENINYAIVKNDLKLKIRRRLQQYYKIGFIDALEKILNENPGEKFIIQVIDNFEVIPKIIELLHQKKLRKSAYLQVFYHGFDAFIDLSIYRKFFETIDELILLTKASYLSHRNYYSIFPCKISLLPNGIDTDIFYKPEPAEKLRLKADNGFSGKKVFIWCSQDRPKKGLTLLLEAWRKVHAKHQDTVLLIVGASRDVAIEGVIFIGKVPNEKLPPYYQMSDCYLFPTLCQEGFGLSLIEALNCGCYCIASDGGGIPEVLHQGKYGKLIHNPNFVSEWETAITDFLTGKEAPITIQKPVYTIKEWIVNMNAIIDDAKWAINGR